MKQCKECGEFKCLEEYHKSSTSPGGRVGKCKKCSSKLQKERRSAPAVKESMAAYGRSEKAVTARKEYNKTTARKESLKRYENTENGRANRHTIDKRSKRLYPDRHKARSAYRYAVLSGKLTKTACEYCGEEEGVEGHHSSYDKDMWLSVTCLCGPCHDKVHEQMELL